MTTKPVVSTVMSVYNEPIEWLRQSIDSILSQTFKDFEFIIICDNPEYTEGKTLLEEYTKKDSRIIVIYNEKNIGLTKSLNKGLAIAKGKYIARMDADDISLPERFEKQVSFFENNKDIIICGTNVIYIDQDEKVLGQSCVYLDQEAIRTSMIFQTQLLHPTVMFYRTIAGKAVRYDEYYRYAQDYALWASFINYEMGNIREALVKYRISQEQVTTRNRSKQIDYSLVIQRHIVNKLGFDMSDYHLKLLSSLIYDRSELEQKANKHIIILSLNLLKDYRRIFSNRGVTILKDWLIIYYSNYLFEKYGKISALCGFVIYCITIRHFPIHRIVYLLHLLFKKETSR